MSKLPSEYDQVILLIGAGIDGGKKAKEFLSRFDHELITIGNEKLGFTNDDMFSSLENKSFGKTMLYVVSHGLYDEEGYLIQINESKDGLSFGDEIFNAVYSEVGHKMDLYSGTCHSGGLFEGDFDSAQYFNNIFTTSSAGKISISTNNELMIDNYGSQKFSFDTIVSKYLHNAVSNTGAIVWNNGNKFESDKASGYNQDPVFCSSLTDNSLLQSCNKFLHIEDVNSLKPVLTSEQVWFLNEAGRLSNNIHKNEETLLNLMKKHFGYMCSNIRLGEKAYEEDEEEDDDDDDQTISEHLSSMNMDFSAAVSFMEKLGIIECEGNHFTRTDEMEFVELSYLYNKQMSGEYPIHDEF
ncbi:MAG: hypothetical protein RLN62_02395 [Rickettsiales bacterium]